MSGRMCACVRACVRTRRIAGCATPRVAPPWCMRVGFRVPQHGSRAAAAVVVAAAICPRFFRTAVAFPWRFPSQCGGCCDCRSAGNNGEDGRPGRRRRQRYTCYYGKYRSAVAGVALAKSERVLYRLRNPAEEATTARRTPQMRPSVRSSMHGTSRARLTSYVHPLFSHEAPFFSPNLSVDRPTDMRAIRISLIQFAISRGVITAALVSRVLQISSTGSENIETQSTTRAVRMGLDSRISFAIQRRDLARCVLREETKHGVFARPLFAALC